MLKALMTFVFCCIAVAAPAHAQDRPATLATLFEDIFGPGGLVVSSDEVTVDGTNHAAHFNSAFQSDFRLMNIALTSQLAAVPLPSPASGFTYQFDPGTGTFVRSTSSFGPILTERGETIGRGRVAFGFSYQFFSFDHLDDVRLSAVPAVFTHDNFEAGGGRTDVVFTHNAIRADVSQWNGALTYGVTDRLDLALAVPIVEGAVRGHGELRDLGPRPRRADLRVVSKIADEHHLVQRSRHESSGSVVRSKSKAPFCRNYRWMRLRTADIFRVETGSSAGCRLVWL